MPAETRLSIRQQLFNAIVERFGYIHQNAGYATNIGVKCFAWRDLDQSPFTDDELSAGGAINIVDPDRDVGIGVLTVHDQVITINVTAAATAIGGYAPPHAHARRMEADLLKAIGVDRQWGGLAKDTIPGKSTIGIAQQGDRIAVVMMTFTILFRTQRFDPYTQ